MNKKLLFMVLISVGSFVNAGVEQWPGFKSSMQLTAVRTSFMGATSYYHHHDIEINIPAGEKPLDWLVKKMKQQAQDELFFEFWSIGVREIRMVCMPVDTLYGASEEVVVTNDNFYDLLRRRVRENDNVTFVVDLFSYSEIVEKIRTKLGF